MTVIRQFMTGDHRHCDDLFAGTEQAVARNDPKAAAEAFRKFQAAMLAHFESEEETLFPSFDAHSGGMCGPTRMMRMEHQQMRSLFEEASEALDAGDLENYQGVADTLLIMMQQHNMKEENVLYPMCDQHLALEADDLVARLEATQTAHVTP